VIAGVVTLAGVWWLARAAETAEALLERYIAATGGRAAQEKIRNRVVKATMEIARQGIKLELTTYAATPNLFYSLTDSELTGPIEQGSDGKVAWSKSVAQGPQLLEGEAKELLLREARLDKLLKWRELYSEARLEGTEVVDGKTCVKLVLTPKTGRPMTWYLDQATNLMLRTDLVVPTAGGEVPMRLRLQDYRDVDGLKLAHRTITEVQGQERVTTIHSIQHNVDLPADRFALPPEVKALLAAPK
jgi:hypothetical protein